MTIPKWRFALTAATIVFAIAPAAHAADLPGIGASDDRVRVDVHVAPWDAVARLQIPGIDRCTAFLVAPRTAVTAAHCLWGARLRRFVPAEAVHLLTGYASGAYALHSVAASYRIGPGYDPARPYATIGADFAVVTLASPLVTAGQALRLDAAPAAPGTRLVLGGFSQDRAEILLADRACQVTGDAVDAQGRMLLRHDCSATHGTSGAPVLVAEPDGTWRVVGVQVAARIGGPGGEAVPADDVLRLVN